MAETPIRPSGLCSVIRIAGPAFLLVLAVPRVATCAPSSLPPLKKIYEQETQSIETDVAGRLEAALGDYEKALVSIEDRCRKSGDLNGLLAVRKEKERLQTEKSVPDKNSSGVPTSVADARASYHRAAADAKVRHATRIRTLSVNYAKHLTALRKQLVIRDKLKQAQVVDGEIKRIDLIVALVTTEIPDAAKPDPKPVPRERKPTPAKLSPEFMCFRAGNLRATTPLTLGQWHHVTGTMDGNEVRLYVDGKLNARDRTDGKRIANSTGSLYIGQSHSRKGEGVWSAFYGSLDDVMIWDRALAEKEVQALYQRGREK